MSAATADERMLLHRRDRRRHAMTLGVAAAAIERPVVGAELASDEAGGLIGPLGASERNVRFAGSEVANLLAGVELDHDARMGFMELPQDRREDGNRVHFLGGDLHRSADIARLSGRGFREGGGGML